MKLVLIATTDDDDLKWLKKGVTIATDPAVTEFELSEHLMRTVIGGALVTAIARAVLAASVEAGSRRREEEAKKKAAAVVPVPAVEEPDPFA